MTTRRLNRGLRAMAILGGAVWAILVSAGFSACADEFNSAGVRIHYTVQGQGDPVVLIHGLFVTGAINWTAPGITAELAKRYRVIALDCRGHGRSGKPEADGSYGTNMVEDVVRLMDHLKIPKAHLVGYSMGGMIAMKLVVTHPERVRSIVLCGMGWHRTGAPLNGLWEFMGERGRFIVPSACFRGLPALGVSESELNAVKVPVTIIIGDRDPCRQLYVEPLTKVRADWPVKVIANAGHLDSFLAPDFRKEVEAALNSASGSKSK